MSFGGIIFNYLLTYNLHPVVDSDLELGGRGGFVLLALPAFLLSVISSAFTQNMGGGG